MQFNGLIDIGVNLTHARFDADRDAVLERAAAAGVTDMIVTGVDVAGSEAAAALAAAHPTILHATAGVHPHHAAEWSPDTAAALSALIERPSTVAIGETGLDYNRDFSPRADQRTAFAAQLRLAADHAHPVFLHQRDATADFLAILREHRDALPDAVLHCFTGDQAMVEACVELDLHFGITGWVTDERRGAALRQCVPMIPTERLMVETDAPFLLPATAEAPPVRRRNEPALLPRIVEAVASLRGTPAMELAASSTATARRFFRLDPPGD